MNFKNCLIYLFGLPAVGKRTIAAEICNQAPFRLIDNHIFCNVVFPFVRVDGDTKMPPEIWEACSAIRDVAYETLIKVGNRDFNYVFTNMLINTPHDRAMYERVQQTAHAMGACFLPVRLVCDSAENKKRITAPDRELCQKATNPDLIDEMNATGPLEIDHPHLMTLDVTSREPQHAAKIILNKLSDIYS